MSIFKKQFKEREFVLFYKEKDAVFEDILAKIPEDAAVDTVDLNTSSELENAFKKDFSNKNLPVLLFKGDVIDYNNIEKALIIYYKKFISEFNKDCKFAFIMKGTIEKPYCKFSKELLKICEEKSLTDLKGFDIFSDKIAREYLKTINNWQTYPMIYINQKFIGGLDKFKEHIINNGIYSFCVTCHIRCFNIKH